LFLLNCRDHGHKMLEHRVTVWKLMRDIPYHGDLEVRVWFRKFDTYPYLEQRHEWRAPDGGEYHAMQEWIRSNSSGKFPENSFPIIPDDDPIQNVKKFLSEELRMTNDPDRMDRLENLLKSLP
jgi:hypothetical protein